MPAGNNYKNSRLYEAKIKESGIRGKNHRQQEQEEIYLVSVHDGHELLPHVLRPPHGSCLDEVLVAPGVAELAGLPRLVHSEKGQVIALKTPEQGGGEGVFTKDLLDSLCRKTIMYNDESCF